MTERKIRNTHRFWMGALPALLLLGVAASASAQQQTPGFWKSFTPNTIGPGSTATLTFYISTQEQSDAVRNLAFTDTLPAGLVIATPGNAMTDCANALLSAPDGGTTISISNGDLDAFSDCTVTVNVTSTVTLSQGANPVVHGNVSGDLTSDAGNSGYAAADLTVDPNRPGFTKSFAPNPVSLGAPSTLTLTIDNSANLANALNPILMDNLPPGMVIASPSRASTDCAGSLTASSGTNLVSLVGGLVTAGASCSVTVDVITSSAGFFPNITSELMSGISAPISSGMASAILEVTRDFLNKAFTDDPVAPGGIVTLEFIVTNFDRVNSATNISFTDDLDATLSGLVATGLPQAGVCGPGSMLSGTSDVSLTDGNLGPESSCTFNVALQVPAAASPGTYTNTTSSITGDVGGVPATSDPATDDLLVEPVPTFTKSFTDDPVAAGGTVDLEFTVTNTSATMSATAIAFEDVFFVELPTAVSVPAPGFCGAGSTAVFTPLSNPPPPSDTTPARLSVSGANLGPGASCSFTITLDVSPGVASGVYPNITSDITATVGGMTVVGPGAADDLTVFGAPRLSKSFIDDPVDPGDTVTLEFTLIHDDIAPGDATAIAFTDNLGAALAGLAATGLPMNNICGAGSQISGTSVLGFTGGSLAPGESCTFSITLDVPGSAPLGSHTNVTSTVTATVSGLATTGLPAADTLDLTGFFFTKSFTNDPVTPGGTVALEFTLTNASSTLSASIFGFTDDLDAVLPGLVAVGLPATNVCGASSSISGTSVLTFVNGGPLAPGASCTFSVTLQVPAGAGFGEEHFNTTSPVTGVVGALPAIGPPATDTLVLSVPPRVDHIGSLPDTGDGQLTECEATKAGLTHLSVIFDRAMRDLPGHAGADDVTNPNNYLLVSTGPDKDFATSACGPAQGDDVAIPVNGVSYAVGSFTATLSVNSGSILPDEQYRLFACATLTDAFGNALDGDGNGVAGDRFARTFRVDRTNVFVNGHMDCDITGWDQSLGARAELTYDSLDADNSSTSGSAHLENLTNSTDFAVAQCVNAPQAGSFSPRYHLGGRARVEAASVGATLGCLFYSELDCSGTVLAASSVDSTGGNVGVWETLSGTLTPPQLAKSAHCGMGIAGDGGSFDAYVDGMEAGTLSPVLTVTLNQNSFSNGNTMTVSLGVDNPGTGSTYPVDFYFGVLLPDGVTTYFFTDLNLNTIVTSISNIASYVPMVSGVDLAPAFDVSEPSFFTYQWSGSEAPGTYTIFLAAVVPGGFADGRVDYGDIEALNVVKLTYSP